MSEERKDPGVEFWIGMALAAPAIYVLSYGPYVFLYYRDILPKSMIDPIGLLYVPLVLGAEQSAVAFSGLEWYCNLWW